MDVFDPREVRGKMIIDNQNDNNNQDDNDNQEDHDNQQMGGKMIMIIEMTMIFTRWEGTPSEKLVLQDIRKPSGEDWEYMDRRQEIVFIGHRMKSQVIQDLLDQCLLTEEEMALGPEMWKETMEQVDIIKLSLDEEEEEDEECDDEDCEDEDCEGAKEEKEEEAPQGAGSGEGKKRKMENKGNDQPLKKR